MALRIERLGIVDYAAAHELQLARVSERSAGGIPDTLLLLEHPLVITTGRGTHPENLRSPASIPVVSVERGGDVTLHAPGQAVGYLIRLLGPGARDLRAHLRLIEGILIGALESLGLDGERHDGHTGVWISDRKIGSVGVACRNWCTWHGFALNVNNDLELFRTINPCGLDASVMTSIEAERGNRTSVETVLDAIESAARKILEAPEGPAER